MRTRARVTHSRQLEPSPQTTREVRRDGATSSFRDGAIVERHDGHDQLRRRGDEDLVRGHEPRHRDGLSAYLEAGFARELAHERAHGTGEQLRRLSGSDDCVFLDDEDVARRPFMDVARRPHEDGFVGAGTAAPLSSRGRRGAAWSSSSRGAPIGCRRERSRECRDRRRCLAETKMASGTRRTWAPGASRERARALQRRRSPGRTGARREPTHARSARRRCAPSSIVPEPPLRVRAPPPRDACARRALQEAAERPR